MKTSNAEVKEKFTKLLKSVGLPYIDLYCISGFRTYLHINCRGKKTAEQWDTILRKFCEKVSISETLIDRKGIESQIPNVKYYIGYHIFGLV